MEAMDIFDRESDRRPRSPMLLFTEEDFQEKQSFHARPSLLSQWSGLRKWEGTSFNLMSIPITPKLKKPTATPTAPVKEKKKCTKIDLKPKKLMFCEEELDSTADASSVAKPSSNSSFRKIISNPFPKVSINKIELPQAKMTKLFPCNKENESANYERAITEQKSRKTTKSQNFSLGYLPDTESISENNVLHWSNVLIELQPEREVGVWVECCNKNCKKWRYIRDCCDPTEVPDIWYCDMNADKTVASCEIPEMSISPELKGDLIENLYNAGSMVWAHINGYPWWPGIVDDCPDTYTYYKLRGNSIKPFMYHVTFINSELLEHAWIYPRYIKPFSKTQHSDMVKMTMYYGIEYKERLDDAYKIALTAVPLTILQRLQKFSFVAQYERLRDIKNFTSMSQLSDQSVIPVTPDTSKSLKELYLSYVEKASSVTARQCKMTVD